MSRQVSPSTAQVYGLLRVTRLWGVSRATLYRHRRPTKVVERKRPGPLGAMADEDLVVAIRQLLTDSPFHGEGHRKLWARLRFAGIRTSRRRVLRLMRTHGLLAHQRAGRPRGPKAHDGTITTDRVDTMWGSDLTSVMTGEGQAAVFIAVDHCSAECVGVHASRSANRFEALEPIKQAVRERFGAFANDIAVGLQLRHDHGSQYVSHDFQAEIRFLGIESSPAFVREPEGNGCAERFIRTLKENLLWVRHFATVEELRLALIASSEPTTKPGSSSGTATRRPLRSATIRSARCRWPRKRRAVSQNRGPVQPATKSCVSVSSPILAWSVLTSTAGAPGSGSDADPNTPAAPSSSSAFQAVIWLAWTWNSRRPLGQRLFSPPMAAKATFAFKAGLWFRRDRLVVVSPAREPSWPLPGRNSTQRPARICKASSVRLPARGETGRLSAAAIPGPRR